MFQEYATRGQCTPTVLLSSYLPVEDLVRRSSIYIQVPFRAHSRTMPPSTYYLTIICYLLPSYTVSLALNAASNPDSSLTLTQPSRLKPNTTTLTEGKIDCDQTRFGNPPSASCRDAMTLLPQDVRSLFRHIKRSYGPRTQGTWDVNLPSRLISCKSIIEVYLLFVAFNRLTCLLIYTVADGKCIIDYTQTSSPSHVLNGDLLAAGLIIQQECIDKDVPPCTCYSDSSKLELLSHSSFETICHEC